MCLSACIDCHVCVVLLMFDCFMCCLYSVLLLRFVVIRVRVVCMIGFCMCLPVLSVVCLFVVLLFVCCVMFM